MTAGLSVAVILSGLCAASAVAAAECAVRSDLEAGIRSTYSDGSFADYRTADDGLIDIRTAASGQIEPDLVYQSHAGLYDLSVAALVGGAADPDRMLRFHYSDTPETLPIPEPGGVWLGRVTTTFPDGDMLEETAIYVFGRADASRRIGECQYQTIPVKVSFIDPDDDWVALDLIWFSDLGIAVATGQTGSAFATFKGRALVGLSRRPD